MPTPKHIAIQKEFEAFKKKVAEVASDFKEKYDLCDDGFNDFISELDLEDYTPKKTYNYSFNVQITTEDPDGDNEIIHLMEYAIIEAMKKLAGDNPSRFSDSDIDVDYENHSEFYSRKRPIF